MKITPLAVAQAQAPSQSSAPPQSARERAIAMVKSAPVAPVEEPLGQPGNSEDSLEMAESLSTKQATVEETSAEAEKTETASDPLSKQYAILAKREKALRAKITQQEATLAAKEADLTRREQEMSTKDSTYSKGYISKDSIKNNTLQALIEAGVDPQSAIQQILEQNQTPVDPRVQAKVDALEAQIRRMEQLADDAKKQSEDQQNEQYKQAIKKLNDDAKKLVYTGDEFETIKATNSVRDVVELIEQTWKEEGRLLEVSEAAQMVEDYLIEEAMKFTKIQKIQKRLNPPVAPKVETAEKTPKTPEQPQPQMKTLTNSNSSARKLSARERALAAFEGKKF